MATNIEIGLYRTASVEAQSHAPGWKHLDMWYPVGNAKLLPQKKIRHGNGHDDLGAQHQIAVVSRGVHRRLAEQALTATLQEFYTQACRHDYDCCGCHSATVNVRRIHGRTYSVITHHSRNY